VISLLLWDTFPTCPTFTFLGKKFGSRYDMRECLIPHIEPHLVFSEQQIHHPAATNVRPIASTVVQDVLILATGVLKCICQDRHTVESTILVDALCEGDDSGRSP
jgi:hypothetical protein